MNSIARAAFMYVFLMLILRLSGKRTLSEVTTFDFILLLIIGDSSQQGITGDDFSVTNAVLVVTTLVFLDIVFSYIKQKYNTLEKWIDGTPLIILREGKLDEELMRRSRVDEYDILGAARKLHGLERLEQIKYAILEKDGGITIVPKEEFR